MKSEIHLNISFSGDFELLQHIIDKYKHILGYNTIKEITKSLGYKDFKTCQYRWVDMGVPERVWNSLHKDLLIFHLMGKISSDESNLRKLEEEFENISN